MPEPLALDDRALDFLRESNALEHIRDIDYPDSANRTSGRGHAWAFVKSQHHAMTRTPVTVDDLCLWQRWITEEQRDYGHEMPVTGIGRLRSRENRTNVGIAGHIAPDYTEVPALMVGLTEDLNAALKAVASPVSVERTAELIGEFLYRFESAHPFADGNGRTGRLLANCVATWCGAEILVFREAARADFFAAHTSVHMMQRYIGDLLAQPISSTEETKE